jgi:hypothetical protein
MKRAVVLVVALLASVLNGSLLVSVSLANPYEPRRLAQGSVNLYLPQNATYYDTVPVKIKVENDWGWGSVESVNLIKVYLDGDSCENVRLLSFSLTGGNVFSASVAGLEPGGHSMYVVVYVTLRDNSFGVYPWFPEYGESSDYSNVVYFSVGLPSPPVVAVSSPEQFGTYNSSSVPLSFGVDKPVSWLGYSLDGGDNVTVSGNATLSGLGGGEHVVVVYARDAYGQTRSSLVRYFSVVLNSAGSGLAVPFWWLVGLIVVASAAAVSFGLVAYVLRRKSKRRSQT